MRLPFQLNIIAGTIAALLLSGCGDADTEIVEKDPIEVIEDDHDEEEDAGRLAVLSAEAASVAVIDLEDGDLLDSFDLTHTASSLTYSAGYRYAFISSRDNDYVGFIDSGLYVEDHGDHLHPYEVDPAFSDYELTGSTPTHITKYDGNTIIFNDGATGTNASIQVLTDADIVSETAEADLPTVEYSVNMHGVALIQGDYLYATFKRDAADSTSSGTLPDQVAVYHYHDEDSEYEQEEILSVNCPDLHGASKNNEYVVFGCSDGVLTAHAHDDEFHAEKISNIAALDDEEIRIASVYGHNEQETLIGVANGDDGTVLVAIHPEHDEMEELEWQPASDASPISYSFSHEGEYFLVLDSKGFLNILAPHVEDGETHWELDASVDITDEDLSTMPDGMSLSMTVSQSGAYAYIADPIAKHIVQVHLDDAEIEGDIELTFSPESLVWLGLPEEHDEDEDHEDDEDAHVH